MAANKKPQRLSKPHKNSKMFEDGKDSYKDEYARWKKRNAVKYLIGIYELAEDEYYQSPRQKLDTVGLDHYQYNEYSDGSDDPPVEDRDCKATGCAMPVVDLYGRVRPVIFVRRETQFINDVVSDMVLTMVLLHELGHAEDISRGSNFDHKTRTFDRVEAEVYAHLFACKKAFRSNYLLALRYYLQNLEEQRESDNKAVSLSAKKAYQELAADEWKNEITKKLGVPNW